MTSVQTSDAAMQPVSAEMGAHREPDTDDQESGDEEASRDKRFEEWNERRKGIEAQPVTITLKEACNLVAYDLDPLHFQEQVFEHIARELDSLSDLAETNQAGFENWCAFQNLRERILLAGKIAAVIGGAS